MLNQEEAAGGETNIGLATTLGTRLDEGTSYKEASFFGGDSGKPSPPSGDVPTTAPHRAPSPLNVDDDVRELENMFLGVDGDGWVGEEAKSLDVSATTATAETIGKDPQMEGSNVDGSDGTSFPAQKSKSGDLDAAENVGSKARQAFSIEEEGEEAIELAGGGGGGSRGGGNRHATVVGDDLEDTEKLLGSIAESLTPGAPLEGSSTGNDSAAPSSMAMTKSELALVNLMVEAGEESGDMLATPGQKESGKTAPNSDGEAKPTRGVARGNSGFDDALMKRSNPDGLSTSVRLERMDSSGNGTVINTRELGELRDNSSSSQTETVAGARGGVGPTVPTTTVTDAGVREAVAPMRSPRSTLRNELVSANFAAPTAAKRHHEEAEQVFSLGHQRWVSCGFKSGLVVDMSGPTSAVSAALLSAGSVLALDSVNYFLWRCDGFVVMLDF